MKVWSGFSTWIRFSVSHNACFPLLLDLRGVAKRPCRSMASPSQREHWLGYLYLCCTWTQDTGVNLSISDLRGNVISMIYKDCLSHFSCQIHSWYSLSIFNVCILIFSTFYAFIPLFLFLYIRDAKGLRCNVFILSSVQMDGPPIKCWNHTSSIVYHVTSLWRKYERWFFPSWRLSSFTHDNFFWWKNAVFLGCFKKKLW